MYLWRVIIVANALLLFLQTVTRERGFPAENSLKKAKRKSRQGLYTSHAHATWENLDSRAPYNPPMQWYGERRSRLLHHPGRRLAGAHAEDGTVLEALRTIGSHKDNPRRLWYSCVCTGVGDKWGEKLQMSVPGRGGERTSGNIIDNHVRWGVRVGVGGCQLWIAHLRSNG